MNPKPSYTKFKWFFPILGILFVLLDGRLTMLFSFFSNSRNICSVQFLLLLIIVAYFCFGAYFYLYSWTIVFGVLYDLYYYGNVGIFAFCLPMMVFLLNHMIRYVRPSLSAYMMIFLLCTIWVLYGSYFMQCIFQIVQIDFVGYMVLYAAPTLLFSALVYYIALLYGRRFFLHQPLVA